MLATPAQPMLKLALPALLTVVLLARPKLPGAADPLISHFSGLLIQFAPAPAPIYRPVTGWALAAPIEARRGAETRAVASSALFKVIRVAPNKRRIPSGTGHRFGHGVRSLT